MVMALVEKYLLKLLEFINKHYLVGTNINTGPVNKRFNV